MENRMYRFGMLNPRHSTDTNSGWINFNRGWNNEWTVLCSEVI